MRTSRVMKWVKSIIRDSYARRIRSRAVEAAMADAICDVMDTAEHMDGSISHNTGEVSLFPIRASPLCGLVWFVRAIKQQFENTAVPLYLLAVGIRCCTAAVQQYSSG